jgi:hypothetical protein
VGLQSHKYGTNQKAATSLIHCLACPRLSGRNGSVVEGGLLMNSIDKCLCFPGHDTGHDTFNTHGCSVTFNTDYSRDSCQYCEVNHYYVNINTKCSLCNLLSDDIEDPTVHSLAVKLLYANTQWGVREQDCTCHVGYARIHDTCHKCALGTYRAQAVHNASSTHTPSWVCVGCSCSMRNASCACCPEPRLVFYYSRGPGPTLTQSLN